MMVVFEPLIPVLAAKLSSAQIWLVRGVLISKRRVTEAVLAAAAVSAAAIVC